MRRPHEAARLVVLLLALGRPPVALAQSGLEDSPPATDTAVAEPGLVVRARALYERAERLLDELRERGVYPEVGSIVSGSGFAGGASLRDHSFGGAPIGGEIEAQWSIRGYHTYIARAGLVGRARDTLRLERARANVADLFNDSAPKTPGAAAYLAASHDRYSRVDFFGVGPSSIGPRTDFAVSDASIDVVGQWQPTSTLGMSARVGVLDPDLGTGTNDSVMNLEEQFDALAAPGLRTQPSLLTIGLAAAADTRDVLEVPTTGAFLGVAVWRLAPIEGPGAPITRVALDGRAFRALGSPRHVAAFRVLAAVDSSAQPTPFYLQYWLGGAHSLRGFSSYRFRGEALAHVSAEYRWRAIEWLDIAPFMDAGAVAAGLDALASSSLEVTPGLGFRVRNDEQVFLRMDWAHGRDGHRVFWSLAPSF